MGRATLFTGEKILRVPFAPDATKQIEVRFNVRRRRNIVFRCLNALSSGFRAYRHAYVAFSPAALRGARLTRCVAGTITRPPPAARVALSVIRLSAPVARWSPK